MKILLVQVDGKMPNPALMKVSAFYKEQGHETGFAFSDPDKVYVSCVFSKNLPHAKGIQTYYPNAEFHIGGPGLGIPNSLPRKMDNIMPDYDLYPDMDYSIGFTTRGCIRKKECLFCIVGDLEPDYIEYKHPSVFHHPDHKKIVFLDNNFTASKRFNETLDYIEEKGVKASFCQGLDFRLITKSKAKKLAKARLYNLHFTQRTIYGAWDLIENEEIVLRGIHNLIEAGVKPKYLRTYVLMGFNTTHEQDYYRVKKLIDLGTEPFAMKYNGKKDDKYLNKLARWTNKMLYRTFPFEEYGRRKR